MAATTGEASRRQSSSSCAQWRRTMRKVLTAIALCGAGWITSTVNAQQDQGNTQASTPQPSQGPATALDPGEAWNPKSMPGIVRQGDKGYFYSLGKWDRKVIPVCW